MDIHYNEHFSAVVMSQIMSQVNYSYFPHTFGPRWQGLLLVE